MTGKDAVLARLAGKVAGREGGHIQQRVALTDGAEALQDRIQQRFPTFTLLLDFIHADEKLWDVANSLFGETSAQGADRRPVALRSLRVARTRCAILPAGWHGWMGWIGWHRGRGCVVLSLPSGKTARESMGAPLPTNVTNVICVTNVTASRTMFAGESRAIFAGPAHQRGSSVSIRGPLSAFQLPASSFQLLLPVSASPRLCFLAAPTPSHKVARPGSAARAGARLDWLVRLPAPAPANCAGLCWRPSGPGAQAAASVGGWGAGAPCPSALFPASAV
jgi:hypothetical protein